MKLLTIETTCDETAAAVVTDQLEVLSSVVASQDALHQRFGGVVPEIASRAHVERILPVIDEALRKADVTLADLDAVAVANTPGLAGSLLVGLTAAKTLCLACDLPLVAVNHLQAHIYACRLASGRDVFPCVGLVVSGGHSNLYRCEGPTDFTPLGGTIDDAAGEAFDKVASLLGLPYPGGPAIERAARSRRSRRLPLPAAAAGRPDAARLQLQRPEDGGALSCSPARANFALTRDRAGARLPAPTPESLARSRRRGRQLPRSRDRLPRRQGGARPRKDRLRNPLRRRRRRGQRPIPRPPRRICRSQHGYELHVPPLSLCTDNAVMGAIAIERLRAGMFEDLSLDISPGPERAATI